MAVVADEIGPGYFHSCAIHNNNLSGIEVEEASEDFGARGSLKLTIPYSVAHPCIIIIINSKQSTALPPGFGTRFKDPMNPFQRPSDREELRMEFPHQCTNPMSTVRPDTLLCL